MTQTISSEFTKLNISAEAEGGYSVYGKTKFYPFKRYISFPSLFTSFSVIGTGYPTATFPVQAKAFVVPSLSSTTLATDGTVTVQFTVAILDGATTRLFRRAAAAPNVRVAIPVSQPNTQGPLIKTFSNVAITSAGSKAGYSLFSGSVSASEWTHGTVEVAILSDAGKEVDVLMVS
ncbi:hypothetical protein BGZ60DRAFT_50502 [Tricladium varicosporioides]|nr:hypothetical protein BGZ60DRAFT_50502 [Hymenoscyphus varicosporioides]